MLSLRKRFIRRTLQPRDGKCRTPTGPRSERMPRSIRFETLPVNFSCVIGRSLPRALLHLHPQDGPQ
jgi:hypothetical protein